jgi:hypothetical protein
VVGSEFLVVTYFYQGECNVLVDAEMFVRNIQHSKGITVGKEVQNFKTNIAGIRTSCHFK